MPKSVVPVYVQLDTDLFADIERHRSQLGMNRTEYMRTAIVAQLDDPVVYEEGSMQRYRDWAGETGRELSDASVVGGEDPADAQWEDYAARLRAEGKPVPGKG